MTDLTPSQDRPGLHVTKNAPSAPATASARCHCGASATANGDAQVALLVQGWTANHGPAHNRQGG
ncbi:hypothetical protein [Streptomyces sp. Z26]|uniref:hypothetical protein n=1 Tax=Streptomyces sp. Z26 TaxID=2500177 RepID=UPI000EF17178|nr:hypothetical protein [Streptomyces sp. Z26]RLL67717.1 hypothetical protein D7M15_13670 [Streptomyces sp. Z26]RLL68897.1 hypothetical protein D7M15_21005 [Streptomyces sp. Z26]